MERLLSTYGDINDTKSDLVFNNESSLIEKNDTPIYSQDPLGGLTPKQIIEEQQNQNNKSDKINEIVFLGFIVILIMVAGYVVDAVKNKKPQYIYNVNVSIQVDGSSSSSDALNTIFPNQQKSILDNYIEIISKVLSPLL